MNDQGGICTSKILPKIEPWSTPHEETLSLTETEYVLAVYGIYIKREGQMKVCTGVLELTIFKNLSVRVSSSSNCPSPFPIIIPLRISS